VSSPRIAKLIEESVRDSEKQDSQEKTKILCLDDDEMIINIMKHLLEANGYEVFTAMDCSAIHDFLYKEKVKILVSDVQMPGMPGTRICQLLKQAIPDLTVVLFSNIPESELARCAEENKADAWISKNWKPAEWMKKIAELAQGKIYAGSAEGSRRFDSPNS
jgi:CheY-like chemotaxis protein